MFDKDHCKDCGKHRSELSEPPWGEFLPDKTLGIQCKPCRRREIENRIGEWQSEERDTSFEDNIICPNCGYEHESDGESSAFYSDGDHEFECVECGDSFTVYTSVSFSYTTYK